VILSGYGDRVARREGEQNHASSYRLADGRTFAIKQSGSVLPEWLCLIDADVSPSDPSRIMPREWVALAMTPDFSALRAVEGLWKEGSEVDWDTGATGAGGRVRGFQRIRYGALVLKEIPAAVDPDLAAARLRDELRRAWPRPFADAEELHRWDQRIRILADLNGESPLLDLSGGDFEFLLDAMVEGKSSFAEIAERNLGDYVKDLLGYADAERVSRECPEKMELSSGRSALVHYRTGQPPWVEGKIQEFFGGKPLPAVCGGKAKLVVHLLAPNNRPVQVTSDLEGFWTNHYPALRRELSRDYPRHFWPEDPRTAEARVFLRPRR
jgi:ATP-dependent helicase HrpB